MHPFVPHSVADMQRADRRRVLEHQADVHRLTRDLPSTRHHLGLEARFAARFAALRKRLHRHATAGDGDAIVPTHPKLV
jgi:hypothetical protein